MTKDEDILNSFCVLAFDEVPNKNFTLKEYINRKADSTNKLNLVEKHLIAREVSKNLKDASAFYDSELKNYVTVQADFKQPESAKMIKSAYFGDVAFVDNKYHLVNPLTKKATAEFLIVAADANFAKLHELIGEARKAGYVDSVVDLDGDLVVTTRPNVSYELKQQIESLGYECEEVDQTNYDDVESVPTYNLRIKMSGKDNPAINNELPKEESVEAPVEKEAEKEEKIDFEKELMEAGESEGAKDKVNETQLEMGKEVEKEHTTNPEIAEKITRDHLEEIPDYYTHLKEMEENAKENDAVKSSYAPFMTVDATKKEEIKIYSGDHFIGTCKTITAAFEKVADEEQEDSKTYTFDELSPEAKKVAIERAGNLYMDMFWDNFDDYLTDFINNNDAIAKYTIDLDTVDVGADTPGGYNHAVGQASLKDGFLGTSFKNIVKPIVEKVINDAAKESNYVAQHLNDYIKLGCGDMYWDKDSFTPYQGFEMIEDVPSGLSLRIAEALNEEAVPQIQTALTEIADGITKYIEDTEKYAYSEDYALEDAQFNGERFFEDGNYAGYGVHSQEGRKAKTIKSKLLKTKQPEVTKTAEDVEDNVWVVEKTSAPTIDDQLTLDIFYVVNKNTHVVAHDAGFEPFLFPTQEDAQKHADKLNSQKEASAKEESIEKKADDQELKQFDMKQELDGQKEFETQDDTFKDVSVPEEKEDTSEVTETMEAKPEETKGESFSASEFGNNLAYIQQNNPESFKSIMNNLKQIMVGDEKKIYDFLENWSTHNFQDFTAMTREDPTYARHSQYQEQLKNNVLPKLQEMQEYKQAMEEKVKAEKGNVESAKKEENIEKKAFDEEALNNVWVVSFGASSDFVGKTKQELIDKLMADRKDLLLQGKGALLDLPYLSNETSNETLYEWLKKWYNCSLREITPPADYDSSDPEDAALYNGEDEGEED